MLQNANGNANMILQNIIFHLALIVVWTIWAIKKTFFTDFSFKKQTWARNSRAFLTQRKIHRLAILAQNKRLNQDAKQGFQNSNGADPNQQFVDSRAQLRIASDPD